MCRSWQTSAWFRCARRRPSAVQRTALSSASVLQGALQNANVIVDSEKRVHRACIHMMRTLRRSESSTCLQPSAEAKDIAETYEQEAATLELAESNLNTVAQGK